MVQRWMKWVFAFVAMASVAVSGAESGKVKIVLVGDSTVTDDAGWGLGFRQFLDDEVELINTSRGGRSSMSFIKEGRWKKALELKGDYYLIQFGHNDQPGKPGRSTSLEQYRGYLNQYVDEARAAGATPILVTPLVRRYFKDPENPNRIVSNLVEWADVVRDIAQQKNVPLIELHDRSKTLCEEMGRDGVGAISPIKPNGQYDGTHLNSAGYVPFGRLVAEELKTAVPALAPHILPAPRNAHPESGAKNFDAVVSFDGSGTHETVQAAIDAVPADTSADQQFRILIKPGVYKEHVVIPKEKRFIQLMGEPGEEENTIISLGTNVKTPDSSQSDGTMSTPDSAVVLIHASDVTCRYITFENTTTQADRVQALACYITGDRVAFLNCRFLSWQDTLRPDSPRGEVARQYFRDCYVEGHVDYIYAAGTAVFERCHIHSKADGYITAANTEEDNPFGFVFLDCKITTGPGVTKGIFLGRPWRPFAASAFIRCDMQEAKLRDGVWNNWGKESNEKTARYCEFGNTGAGALVVRAPWAKMLSDEEAAQYTVKNILGGTDGWAPGK